MTDLKRYFNMNEINLVLRSPGNLLHYQVCGLIEKIQQQALLQLQNNSKGSGPSEKTSPLLTKVKVEEIIHQR